MHSRLCGLLLAILAIGTQVLFAETAGDHPAYVHALADLRDAHAWLAKPEENPRKIGYQMKALADIEAAIAQITGAAIHDGKKPGDSGRINTDLPRIERLNRALARLNHAWQEINDREDSKFARGLQTKALRHIDLARGMIRKMLG